MNHQHDKNSSALSNLRSCIDKHNRSAVVNGKVVGNEFHPHKVQQWENTTFPHNALSMFFTRTGGDRMVFFFAYMVDFLLFRKRLPSPRDLGAGAQEPGEENRLPIAWDTRDTRDTRETGDTRDTRDCRIAE